MGRSGISICPVQAVTGPGAARAAAAQQKAVINDWRRMRRARERLEEMSRQIHKDGWLMNAGFEWSEEPAQAHRPQNTVHTQVRRADPRAGQVHVADLQRQGDIVFQEPMDAHAALEVELENVAEIRFADAGPRHPCAAIHEGDQAVPVAKL